MHHLKAHGHLWRCELRATPSFLHPATENIDALHLLGSHPAVESMTEPRLLCAYAVQDELMLAAPINGGRAHAFGVFDGHGGARAARMLGRLMPAALSKHAPSIDKTGHDSAAWAAAFGEVDAAILKRAATDGWDDGSTALVAIIESPLDGSLEHIQLTLLQAGDCDAVLCTADGTLLAQELVRRHRPTEPSEAKRLAAVGVHASATGRVMGLAVSRAFGDASFKQGAQPYLIAEPEVCRRTILPAQGGSSILILACDGLWDFVSAQQACDIVREELALPLEPLEDDSGAQIDSDGAINRRGAQLRAAALKLAEAALECGGDDNVSVIVVQLELK